MLKNLKCCFSDLVTKYLNLALTVQVLDQQEGEDGDDPEARWGHLPADFDLDLQGPDQSMLEFADVDRAVAEDIVRKK